MDLVSVASLFKYDQDDNTLYGPRDHSRILPKPALPICGQAPEMLGLLCATGEA
jgi:hypothetical protein